MQDWIIVASGDHIARGVAGGFMQVNHGKSAPLRRMQPGDRVACYSPVQVFRTATPLKSFTAVGEIRKGEIYQGDMGGGFTPFRRDVTWWPSRTTPIAPLLDALDLTAGKRNWGYPFRFGVLPISGHDMNLILAAMTGRHTG